TSRPIKAKAVGELKPDRLQLSAWGFRESGLPPIPGYRVVRDIFVRRQTTCSTYLRSREYINPVTETRIFIQYAPQLPGLSQFKVTVVPEDSKGLSCKEIRRVVKQF